MKFFDLLAPYIEIKNKKVSGFSSVKCPFHDDSNASAGIDLSTGVFSCKACSITYSAQEFISALNGIDIEKATAIVSTFKREKGISKTENNTSKTFKLFSGSPHFKELYDKSRENPNLEVINLFCTQRKIKPEIAIREGMGTLSGIDVGHYSDELLITMPYIYNKNVVGIRYRDLSDSKKFVEGSLHIPWGCDSVLPEHKLVIICEGETDRLKLLSELNSDIPVISIPGNNFDKTWKRVFDSVEHIIVIPDSDEAGENLVRSLKKVIQKNVHVINLPWKKDQLGKDICEWCAQNDFSIIENKINAIHLRAQDSGVMDLSEFTSVINKPKDVGGEMITNFLYKGQIVVIGGAQKSRKTFLTLNLMRSLSVENENFLGIPDFVSLGPKPNILYVQNEGSKLKFAERIQKILLHDGPKDNCKIWFKPGIQLDKEDGVRRIRETVEHNKIEILIFDTYQRMHTKEENSSSDTAEVWNAVVELCMEFPNLCIILLHHFSRKASAKDKWDALRGSTRMGGEADLGIFMELGPEDKYGKCNNVYFDGRDLIDITTPGGNECFVVKFDEETLKMYWDSTSETPNKTGELIKFIEEKGGTILLNEALERFQVSNTTVKTWVKMSKGRIIATAPSRNNPTQLKIVK